MKTSTVSAEQIPAMIATLCSYEDHFGPYHLQTLALAVHIAAACWRHGDPLFARRLLERVIADLDQESEMRIRAAVMLRDLLLEQGEISGAGAVQSVLCEAARLGAGHPAAVAARAELAAALLEGAESGGRRM